MEWYLLQHAKGAQKSSIRDTSGIVFIGSDTLLYKSMRGWEYRTKTKFLSPQFFINGRELFAETNDVAETYRNIYYNIPIEKVKKIVLKRVVGNITKSNFREHFPLEIEQEPSPHMVSVDRYFLYLTLTEDALLGFNHGSLDFSQKGYHELRTFYKPLSEEEALKTSYSPTVFWEPNLNMEASKESVLKFFNTNKGGRLRIVIEGLTEKGQAVFDTRILEVHD